jgi:hypothetical protein
MQTFSLSANIENTIIDITNYIVTPNTQNVIGSIVNGYNTGLHTFNLIGSYGTGKSSFLLALEHDLTKPNQKIFPIFDSKVLSPSREFEILKLTGDYEDLAILLSRKLGIEGNSNSVIDTLRNKYNELKSKDKFLVIIIDEFGKVLEHAAKNNPERELYFLQKLAEFVNSPNRRILLLTTLHQNFNSYARNLSREQREEWTKVKGRFKEVVFVEPIEQLLFLASQHLSVTKQITTESNLKKLYELGIRSKLLSSQFSYETAKALYPLDPFSSYIITQAIQRYGQNERSLFSFLVSKGKNSLREFTPSTNLTYNLQYIYDYIIYNFYSYLRDANADSMNWSAMRMSVERAEGIRWDVKEELLDAVKIVKTIGLLNLFGSGYFTMSKDMMAEYASCAMDIKDPQKIINVLERNKIIRYAEYKHRLILFEGTDINIEDEISKANLVVSRPVDYVNQIRTYFNKKVAPVKAYYYKKGTPRYFKYQISDQAQDLIPENDTDGYIQLIFHTDPAYLNQLLEISSGSKHANVYAYFKDTDEIVEHLYKIEKYNYIKEHVLIDNSDKIAITEFKNLTEYEISLLNKSINQDLFNYIPDAVIWIYKGKIQQISSQRDFNRLLSKICDEIYDMTPVMNSELFNKNKLSSQVSAAKVKYLSALVNSWDLPDIGLDPDKFPPEKTIYYSLLKNTGLHKDGSFNDCPSNHDISALWNACEDFLKSTINKPRKISELIKKLSDEPFKLKSGFLDFWIPTYLFIKRQDYSLYGTKGTYILEINMEFFALLQKHPSDYQIKAFDISGVKMEFFNQYRKFINVEEVGCIKTNQFIDTIKPFFFFYNRQLNDYARNTKKFDHDETRKFRDILGNAKDPERTFFEDLPTALGYDRNSLKGEQFAKDYGYIINRAVRELRSCYSKLIDRIEDRLIASLGLSSNDYDIYILEIRNRLKYTKTYLLTDRLKEFYSHAMSNFDNKVEWYQSICYVALDQPLERLHDEQEEKLVNELILLFKECEKYADISKIETNGKDEIYSFDLVSSYQDIIRPQTYRLLEHDIERSKRLEEKINNLLNDDDSFDVATLLRILKKRIQ